MNRREIITTAAAAVALSAVGAQAAVAAPLYAQALRDEPIRTLRLQKVALLRDGRPAEHMYMEVTYASGVVERVETNFLILMATTRLAKQDEDHPASSEFIRDVTAAIEKRVA
jgi:hypothetical protein